MSKSDENKEYITEFDRKKKEQEEHKQSLISTYITEHMDKSSVLTDLQKEFCKKALQQLSHDQCHSLYTIEKHLIKKIRSSFSRLDRLGNKKKEECLIRSWGTYCDTHKLSIKNYTKKNDKNCEECLLFPKIEEDPYYFHLSKNTFTQIQEFLFTEDYVQSTEELFRNEIDSFDDSTKLFLIMKLLKELKTKYLHEYHHILPALVAFFMPDYKVVSKDKTEEKIDG